MTRDQRLVLVIAILASFVAFLDGSVINVALPAISRELGGGLSTQQWVVDAYLVTLGALILLAGSLSDVFGRVVVLRVGLLGFGIASLLIAVAPSAALVIALRAVQGIAGALLVPSSLALILSSFRDAAQSKAIGRWTAWTSLAFLAGPVLGGLFVDFFSWRLVFAINVLPIAVTLWLLVVLRHPDERRGGMRVDYPGAILGVLGLGGPVFALIEQGTYGWGSPVIHLPFAIGVLAFAAFIWWQGRAPQPMLPLGLFAVRNFSVGNVTTALVYGAMGLGSVALTVYLQEVAGLPATLAALAFLPISLANIFLSTAFGTLSGKYGPRLFMTLGPILGGAGFLLMAGITTPVDYWFDTLPGMLLFALGLSMTVAPLTSAILGSISAEQAGIGSAVNNAVARIAGLIMVALLGIVAGGALGAESIQRVLVVVAAMLVAGGLVSWLGIRNPRQAATDVVEG